MKRVGIILSLSILMILMSFSMCFASGLKLVNSNPQDGSGGYQPENLMVKLYFNEDVSAKEVQDANKDAFKFTDAKGKEISTRVLYNSKNLNEIWVLVDKALIQNTEYKLQISGDLQIPNGDTLGQDETIAFTTRNTSMDNTVNMGLMFVMMIGMIVFTSISAKRTAKKQEEEAKVEDKIKVNPYKVAKETGKSVEDVVAKTVKEKEKAKAHAEKKNKGRVEGKSSVAEDDTDAVTDNKRVTGPRPISATGSTFTTGRKEMAEIEREKAAAKAAAGTTRPKSATGKAKNKKANSSKK